MTHHPRLAYTLLAAGSSTRFGSCKQLAKIDFKKTMLEHALETALDVAPGELTLVLGANKEAIQDSLDFGNGMSRINIEINEKWEEGMGASISVAVKHIMESNYDGVLILLADQIDIKAEQLKQMRDLWFRHPTHIVAAHYNGVLGAPAIFPSIFFDQLSKLVGDIGAKHLIQAERDKVKAFPLAEAQRDIDTENQLNNWQIDAL